MNITNRVLIRGFAAVLLIASEVESAKAFTTNLVPVADTTLYQTSPDNNLGANPTLIIGTTATGFKNRGLIKFTLNQLPTGAVISSAALMIGVVKAAAGPGSTFEVHRVLRDWGEGLGTGNQGTMATNSEATWNNRFHPSVPWSTAGAEAGVDYAVDSSATNFVDSSGSYKFASTPGLVTDVQAWLNNPGTNFGWILISDSEGTSFTARRVASREDTVNTPILAIQYIAPPTSSAPTIFGTALVGNKIRFSFDAESNLTYAVEFRDALTSGDWNMLTNIPAQPTSATFHITNTISSAERYFRARTP